VSPPKCVVVRTATPNNLRKPPRRRRRFPSRPAGYGEYTTTRLFSMNYAYGQLKLPSQDVVSSFTSVGVSLALVLVLGASVSDIRYTTIQPMHHRPAIPIGSQARLKLGIFRTNSSNSSGLRKSLNHSIATFRDTAFSYATYTTRGNN
jgi:hypothetical protein